MALRAKPPGKYFNQYYKSDDVPKPGNLVELNVTEDDDDDDDWALVPLEEGETAEDSEEDVYNISTGWNMDILDDGDIDEDQDKDAIYLAGLRLTPKLEKALREEAKTKRKDAKEARGAELGSNKSGKVSFRDPKKLRGKDRSVHKKMRIIGGEAGGVRLYSPQDRNVRPMMERVRNAMFNMVQAQHNLQYFPDSARWLDLYAGTGSVGLEAMSRGCGEGHFVELDPWVVKRVLGPNISACKMDYDATVHTQPVESFLEETRANPMRVGGPFDFISITPPYEAVTYTDLMATLQDHPLISNTTTVMVEYPRLERKNMPDELGELVKLRDRKYGRTWLAIYGPLPDEDEDHY